MLIKGTGSKAKRPKKVSNPVVIKISDTMFIHKIDVKRDWMYAELVIQIPNQHYLGKWEYKETSFSTMLGDEKLENLVIPMNLVIPIKKKKRDWDKPFWSAADMFWHTAYKSIDLEKMWDEANETAKKRQIEKISSKEEKEEESRILKHSW